MLRFVVLLSSLFLRLIAAIYSEGWDKEHSGSQIWRASCGGSDCRSHFENLHDQLNLLHHDKQSLSFVVRPEVADATKQLLAENQLTHDVVVEDVADHLRNLHEEEEREKLESRASSQTCVQDDCPRPLTDAYMTFEQIEWFLHSLQKNYPDNVKLTEQGKSTEGRSLWMVKVFAKDDPSKPAPAGEKKRAVFVEGGIHAREWVSPATVLHMLHTQVSDCASGKECDMIYYFMPSTNPDGYTYTWTKDRLWRKNRSKPPKDSECFGIDLNRNFGYKYGQTGASTDPCRESYRGVSAFEATETQVIRNTLAEVQEESDLCLYLSYHSYSQLILWPWGFATLERAPFYEDVKKGALVYKEAVKSVHGSDYVAENSADLYPAAGASDDFAKSQGVKYVYTIELRDTGEYGFQLPAAQIMPTFEENWAGFKALTKLAMET